MAAAVAGVVAATVTLAACNDYMAPEPGPGPAAGDPLAGLTPSELTRFTAGQERFRRLFAIDQGLGPLFNETGCGACHFVPAAGGNGVTAEFLATAELADGTCDPLLASGGPVFQRRVAITVEQAYGFELEPIPPEATATAEHATPDLFGFGLLEAVPESEILSRADPNDANGDGISGRVGRTAAGEVGRFGRMATFATISDFVAEAFLVEMGITSPSRPDEGNAGGLPLPPGSDPVPDPEVGGDMLRLTTAFILMLAPPSQLPLSEAGENGRRLFSDIGCADCHVPTLRTGDHSIAALANRQVAAYTDLLLHDMGPQLASVCLGSASPGEMRTEPLMGLRLVQRFLHDSRAGSITEAITLHAGEATAAREAFRSLSAADRRDLLEFLSSL
jgi:CxxC motif-containing protein (DUF1111 family)